MWLSGDVMNEFVNIWIATPSLRGNLKKRLHRFSNERQPQRIT